MSDRSVLYVLNGFARGGAELGLATLLKNGFLSNTDLRVFVFARIDDQLRNRICGLIGAERVLEATAGDRLTACALLRGGVLLFWQIWKFRPRVAVLSLKQANIVGRSVLLFWPRVHCVSFEHIAQLERGRLVGLYEKLLRLLSPRVDEVWADCATTLRESRAYYRGRRKRAEAVVPLFIAATQDRKQRYGVGNPVRIVAAGRLMPRKRFELVVEAIKLLDDRGIDAICTFYGSGPSRSDLLKAAGAAGVCDRVQFAGFVENWWDHARSGDIFVNPSDEEGLCIVAAEAMMVGLPVVVTPVGGLKDYTSNGVNAVHIERGRPDAIADAVQELIGDEKLRIRLGQAAARTIEARFSLSAARRAYEEIETRLAVDDLGVSGCGRR